MNTSICATFRMITISVVVFGLLAGTALAQNNSAAVQPNAPGPGGSEKSTKLLKKAARDNDMELALAEVGARRAKNPQLKQYCLELQQQQLKAGEHLKPIASRHGVSVDQSLTRKDEKELARLERSKGAKFDRNLARHLLSEQQQEISALERANAQATSADFKHYLDQVLPKERAKLQKAQTVAKEVGLKQSTISSIVNRTPAAVGGAGE